MGAALVSPWPQHRGRQKRDKALKKGKYLVVKSLLHIIICNSCSKREPRAQNKPPRGGGLAPARPKRLYDKIPAPHIEK